MVKKYLSRLISDGDAFEGVEHLREFADNVISNMRDPIMIFDDERRFIAANKRLFKFFKQSEEDLVGKSIEELFGTPIWKCGNLDVRFKELLPLKEVRESLQIEGKFPKIGERILLMHIFRARAKPKVEYLAVFVDKTKEIQEQRLILKSKERLLEVFDGIRDPIVIIGQDSRVMRLNRSMLDMLDAPTFQECIGKTCKEFFRCSESKCNDECPIKKTVAEGEAKQVYWMMDVSKSGGRLFDVLTYPLIDVSGKVHAVVMFCRDITHALKVEAELYESERVRILGSLAAGVAHEVRNPLAIISSTAQYCKTELPGDSSVQGDLDTIIKASLQANSVIGAMMDFARPRDVCFEIIPIDRILDEGLNLVKNRCKKAGIKITTSFERKLPHLKLDRQAFLQAYVNILLNSIDSMGDGGDLRVDARMSKGGRRVEIEITDTGKGVPCEIVGRVFQPFYSTKKDGIGLGLPLAEEIVRAHGGKLTFSGTEGKGAVAKITLPSMPDGAGG